MAVMERVLLLVALIAFFLMAMVLPAVRMRVRTGVWGIAVLRTRDPVQRVIGLLLSLSSAAVAFWALLFATRDPAELGIWAAPAWVGVLGWAAIALGFAVIVVAQAQMGASWRIGIDADPTALVTGGIYRFVRNPIYTGLIAMVFGVVLVTPSPWSIGASLAMFLVIEIQTRLEERHLRRQHGASYLAWAARVGRFVPGVGRLSV